MKSKRPAQISKLRDMAWCAAKLYLSRMGLTFPPFSLVWYITWLCNSKCSQCGWGRPYPEYKEYLEKELSSNRIKEIISEAAALGCRHIAFAGGEPLLKKDIFKILKHAKNAGILVEISSNGFAIDKNTAHKLVDSGVDNIHISLDSPDELHDQLRNVPGAFEKVDQALDHLVKLRKNGKFYLGINSVIYGLNLEKLKPLRDYALRKKLDGISFQVYHPGQTRDFSLKGKLVIRPEQIPGLKDTLNDLVSTSPGLIRSSKQYLRNIASFCEDPKMGSEPCLAGHQQIYVFPFGEISPCCFLERIGDLKTQSFKNLIYSKEMNRLREKSRVKDCPGCWSPGTHEFNTLLRIKNLPSSFKVAYNYLRTT